MNKSYKIIESEGGYFEIQEQIEHTKLTFKGFKKFLVWEKMYISCLWNGKWVLNLFDSMNEAKEFLIAFKEWNNRELKEEIINL